MISEEAFRFRAVSDLSVVEGAPNQPKHWKKLEPWQLSQLMRLAKFDPARMERILNRLWRSDPNLFEELAISAVEHGELSIAAAAESLEASEPEVEYRVDLDRDAHWTLGQSQILETDRGAKLEDAQVFVWEIVREYRRLGSVEQLTTAFPGLTTAQLGSALGYAREHPQEIEEAISAYEKVRSQIKSQYPCA